MNTQRLTHIAFASAIAVALCSTAALAQTTMPGSAGSQPLHAGAETRATYPLPDSHGGTLTVISGMPEHVTNYGPPPAFSVLDTNHNGRISEAEARAYPPLDSGFLFASHGGKSISRAQYQAWVKHY